MLIFCQKSYFFFFSTSSKINRFPTTYFLQEQHFCFQFVKYVLILQLIVKKSIFEIKFWDWNALNLQKKFSQIFVSNCAKFLENCHPWKLPKICNISCIEPKQYFLQPQRKHFKNKIFKETKLVWCGHHKTFFYVIEILLKWK